MKKATYIARSISDKNKNYILLSIQKYGGTICEEMSKASLIITDLLTSDLKYLSKVYSNTSASLIITLNCFKHMENEVINPFTYRSNCKFLYNTFLKGKKMRIH